LAGVVALGADAQRVSGSHEFNGHLNAKPVKIKPSTTRAAGDTLFYTDAEYFYGTGIDGTFNYTTEDVDGLVNNPGGGPFPSNDFGNFYSLQPVDYFPWDVDTAFYWAATSWFDPQACCASNWLEFGPINIPAAGATVQWWVKTNPSYRDGYEIKVNTTALSFSDFVDPAIYSRPDLYPSSTTTLDTTWQMYSVTLPATYNGMPIYLAVHHNANDMDVFYVDEILVTEGSGSAVAETNNSGMSMSGVFPNPTNSIATFNLTLDNAASVSYKITDLAGKVVMTGTESKAAGNNKITFSAEELATGTYYVTVTANGNVMTRKMQILK
ncbi:MAG TPA: T9SS type A sorting domain-containing protein, partial [Flavobacteriales bacterium]|nr:T9SS type A sorting domain-containing protein [Flavobacteriales bacterium]